MKAGTLKLLIPVVAVTVQNNSANMIIPPFLQHLQIPVVTIGTLISLNPIAALVSRIPMGIVYREHRARLFIAFGVIAMGITNFLYSFASDSLTFAVVHLLNGFAYGAVTTLYMAFYVDSLPAGENRNHAMGYYVGTLALGYSTGNFLGGGIADWFGYAATFRVAAFLSLVPVALLWLLRGKGGSRGVKAQGKVASKMTWRGALKAILDPGLATVIAVALFLNLVHQASGVFITLYGLGVGLTLTQVGVLRAAYAGCNAITRPISGHVVDRLGHRWISYVGFPVQCALMMFIPLFTGFGSILAVYISAGVLRAVVIVANAVGLVQDVDEARVRRGVASGIYNAAGDLGNVLGPTIGGLIAAATSVSGVFIVAPVASTILFLFSMWGIRAAQNRSPVSSTSS